MRPSIRCNQPTIGSNWRTLGHHTLYSTYSFFTHRDFLGWLRVVEPIDGRPVGARHQMPVDVDRHLDGAVAHLFLHVRQRFTLLNQERCERVTEIMEPDAAKLGLLEMRSKT